MPSKWAVRSCTLALVAVLGVGLGVVLVRTIPPLPRGRILSWPVSTMVTDRHGVPLTSSLATNDEWCLPVSLDQMGRWTGKILIAVEDRRFWRHGGMDVPAVLRAAWQNARAGKTVSGASTLTSQLMRLSVERPRTLPNKALEFWQALQLERLLTKEQILELYLNRAPFGGNLRGIEAAAQAYFAKSARDLSCAESALLVGLVRNPSGLRPDRYPIRARVLRDQTLELLVRRGVISREIADAARREPVVGVRHNMPAQARMACAQLLARRSAEGVVSLKQGAIRSTLDASLQGIIEQALRDAVSPFPLRVTAAAVLIENRSGAVRAYVGNARHGFGTQTEWVDCANAPRSPGSTLKPFVYALAFETGKIAPSTLLADTPLRFRGSAPRHFDLSFRGPVSARTSLAHSLNVPAVRVLRSVSYEAALDLYRRLGFSFFTEDAPHYADALVLGGCETTLLELARAYWILARGGEEGDLSWEETPAAPSPGKRLFSPDVCYLTLDILKDTRRLVPLYQQLFEEKKIEIAFKTGTSYALRDAWTVACTPQYTLAVWLGDPRGAAHPDLIGLRSAAPTALQILRKIVPPAGGHFERPAGIFRRKVCALSGKPPSSCCPTVREEEAIRDVSDAEVCDLHVLENGNVVVRWPSELAEYRADVDIPPADSSLRIVSPVAGRVYYTQNARTVRLELRCEGVREEVYWFLNQRFLGKSAGTEAIYVDVPAGNHILSVSGANGLMDRIRLRVGEGEPLGLSEEEILH